MQNTPRFLQGREEEAGWEEWRGLRLTRYPGRTAGRGQEYGLGTLAALPLTDWVNFGQVTAPCQPPFPHPSKEAVIVPIEHIVIVYLAYNNY